MSKSTNPVVTEKDAVAAIKAALENEAGQKAILACMDKLFAEGKWEIPDDAVAGLVKNKVDQLDAQVKSLTARMVELSGASAVVPGERVNALEATKKGKGKK